MMLCHLLFPSPPPPPNTIELINRVKELTKMIEEKNNIILRQDKEIKEKNKIIQSLIKHQEIEVIKKQVSQLESLVYQLQDRLMVLLKKENI